jgi:hypothetical protein
MKMAIEKHWKFPLSRDDHHILNNYKSVEPCFWG